jgi:hypothetical protein
MLLGYLIGVEVVVVPAVAVELVTIHRHTVVPAAMVDLKDVAFG